MTVIVRPLTLRQANAAVTKLHRHHKPVRGHRFSIGLFTGPHPTRLVGALIVGRPVARAVPAYRVAEVTRLATDGTKNACSILYSAAARACLAMGYERIQTYILEAELGTSLRAAGWKRDEIESDGGDWNCNVRSGRRTDQPLGAKQRWSKALALESIVRRRDGSLGSKGRPTPLSGG